MTNDIAVRVHKDSVVQDSIYGRRVRGLDVFLTVIIYTCAGFSILLLAGIMGYVFVRGIPHVTWAFLSTASSATKGTFGILGNIINTLYIVIITLLIATPIGISSAIYLTQYARQGRLVRAIRFTTEILSGIPSILFGLFGYTVFCVMFRMGTSILAGCLTMTLCILPTIVRTTEESLLAVPGSYKEGAMALGAGKLRVILGIVLPCAIPGILTAVILAMGRIVGESAALLYTSGMSYNMPKDFFGQIMNSGRTLTLHLYQTAMQATSDDAFHIAFATAAVLLVIVFLLNLLASLVSKTLKKGEQ